MEEEEDEAFYVVRKGDIIGVYSTLTHCQSSSLLSSSLCGPSIGIYKGYSLPKEAEKYLVSHGLKNSIHSINVADVKEDLFGTLTPCPLQLPDSKGKAIQQSFSEKDDAGSVEIEQEYEGGSVSVTSLPIDAFQKYVKLDASVKNHAAPSKCFSGIISFAGSSNGNPGKAGAGAILQSEDGAMVFRLREGLGITTCDVAEYRAIILGLKHALRKGFTQINLKGHSKLVCMQMQGTWKTKDEKMLNLCKEVQELKNKFLSFQINLILKEHNTEAAAEADLAIYFADGQVHEVCEMRQI